MRRRVRSETGRLAGIFLILTAALVIAGLAGARPLLAQPGVPEPPPISVQAPPMAPPLAAGPPADLDLLVTAQVTGWIEPCG